MKAGADSRDFVAVVAGRFLELRGRGTMLSPADLACLVEWERAGVDATAAIRGINEAFRRGGDIRSLRQCRWAVEEERRKVQRGGGAARTEKKEEPPLNEKLADLASALEEAARNAGERHAAEAVGEAAAAVRKLADRFDGGEVAAAQKALDEIEKELFARIQKAVPSADLAALEAEARGQLRGRKLEAEVARRTVRAILTRKLRERFRLPSFAV